VERIKCHRQREVRRGSPRAWQGREVVIRPWHDAAIC